MESPHPDGVTWRQCNDVFCDTVCYYLYTVLSSIHGTVVVQSPDHADVIGVVSEVSVYSTSMYVRVPRIVQGVNTGDHKMRYDVMMRNLFF
jgi:hypothetical protein